MADELLPGEWSSDGERISDDELAELALSADPEPFLGPDAVPLRLGVAPGAATLSSWYMPAVVVQRASGWRRPVLVGIVATLVVLEALGLCSVFGQVVIG